MRKTISSALTFVMKVVFPVLWIAIVGPLTVRLFLDTGRVEGGAGGSPSPAAAWIVLVTGVLGSAVIYWFCVRLKRVELDRKALYVSNFVKQVVVPLREVDRITENRWVNIHPVTIHFRRDRGFGKRIVFMPTHRWFGFSSSHPIVAELRRAVERVRATPDDSTD